ncbi:hypothetical protein BC831DRAFT_170468 [Entophlyctis helioformis]|nr:hypothetical protein BC831DRAFT_170468 [Entophlyctis helioformis]
MTVMVTAARLSWHAWLWAMWPWLVWCVRTQASLAEAIAALPLEQTREHAPRHRLLPWQQQQLEPPPPEPERPLLSVLCEPLRFGSWRGIQFAANELDDDCSQLAVARPPRWCRCHCCVCRPRSDRHRRLGLCSTLCSLPHRSPVGPAPQLQVRPSQPSLAAGLLAAISEHLSLAGCLPSWLSAQLASWQWRHGQLRMCWLRRLGLAPPRPVAGCLLPCICAWISY